MNKPRLTFWQIWNMSVGFLGIQVGWWGEPEMIRALIELR